MTCPDVQDRLEAHVTLGEALSPEVQAHLRTCADCRAHLAFLQHLQLALLEDAPPVEPPPALRGEVLRAARGARPARWRWPLTLGAAAVLGAVTLTALLAPPTGVAASAPDPAVVVSVDDRVLVASNDRAGTLTLLRGDRTEGTLRVPARLTPWFTEGVRLGDRVFLADAANDRVLELQLRPLTLRRTHRVPPGVAGLSAVTGPGGARVYFKSVQGVVGLLGGREITVADDPGMPLADVMDAVTLFRGTLVVTHHLRGEVCLIDPDTLQVRRVLKLGGMPVALESTQDGLLVLDVTGRLLLLDGAFRVARTWTLGGHPDKLSVNDREAVITDRAGTVTRLPLAGGAPTRLTLTHPMDVTVLPDGSFAVAEGGRGVQRLPGTP